MLTNALVRQLAEEIAPKLQDAEARLTELEGQIGDMAIEEVLADISKDRMTAARKVMALVENDPAHMEALMTAARRLIFSKGRDSHDYKFSSAALEDYYHATAPWRARSIWIRLMAVAAKKWPRPSQWASSSGPTRRRYAS